MTIRQQGGVFGRNPVFNDLSANSASFTALTAGTSSLGAITGTSFNIAQFKTGTNILESNVSGQNGARLRAAVSSAAFPTFSFTSDNNTGLYNQTADVLGVSVGGAEAGSFTSNGLAFPNGKGIDFSATSGTGTSELFDDYEEGTWTPVDASGAGLVLAADGFYTKIGNLVYAGFRITYPSTADASASTVGGLPFTVAAFANGASASGLRYTDAGFEFSMAAGNGTSDFVPFLNNGSAISNASFSTKRFDGMVIYQTT